MPSPKLTVVTPSFNQGRYIAKTIESVLDQRDENLEHIIIDGGSTDDTLAVIRKYERHLTYWVSEKDRGQSHAINKGMARATGEYLTWLNSDDWYVPGAIRTLRDGFAAHPQAGMVVGVGHMRDVSGELVREIQPDPEITLQSLYTWMTGHDFLQPSSAFTRGAWKAAGGTIDESVHIALDVDLWLRMARAGVQFATTPGVVAQALIHPNAKTTAFDDLSFLDCGLVICRHGGEAVARKTLEDMITRYSWYRRNYEAVVSNPVLKLLRPVIKRFAKPGGYWNEAVPPWLKQ